MQSNAFEQAQLIAAARARRMREQFTHACAGRFSAADDDALRRSLRLVQIALGTIMGSSAVTLVMYNVALWLARTP